MATLLPPFLLVVDLEATCDRDRAALPKGEMETIEIGAVLVETSTLAPVADVGTFVRPIRHPRLSAFCTELTTIRQADVDGAPLFPAALAKVKELLGCREALFCSWGDYDRNQLAQDARLHRVSLAHVGGLGGEHLNLKRRFSEVQGLPKKLGMGQALRHVGLELVGTHHRGIDDARNIARLLPWIVG